MDNKYTTKADREWKMEVFTYWACVALMVISFGLAIASCFH